MLVLSRAAASFYQFTANIASNCYPPCPAFTIYNRFVPTRQLTVYTAVPTNFPNFPQPPRHCLTDLTHLPTPLRRRNSASRSSRAFSPPRTRAPCPPSGCPYGDTSTRVSGLMVRRNRMGPSAARGCVLIVAPTVAQTDGRNLPPDRPPMGSGMGGSIKTVNTKSKTCRRIKVNTNTQ